jgi:hypothetical protein
MRVVMTLLVRDAVDLVAHHLRYHLARGVDFVIATDHRSTDGTTDVLRELEREGRLHLIHERDEALRQNEWVTHMARLAATSYGADWVVNSDVDEFWWPRDGTFHEILAAVPERFGVVRGLWRHFVPRPGQDEAPFYERMVVRRASIAGVGSMYCSQVKVVHRGDSSVVVGNGNHDAFGERLVLLREWYPFEVLHFPVRTRSQMEEKFVGLWEGRRRREDGTRMSPHVDSVVEKLRSRDAEDVFGEFLVDDTTLEQGLAAGVFTLDARLRDALRALAAGRPVQHGSSDGPSEELLREIDAHQESDAAAQVRARIDSVFRRQQALEGLLVVRAGRRRGRLAPARGTAS